MDRGLQSSFKEFRVATLVIAAPFFSCHSLRPCAATPSVRKLLCVTCKIPSSS
jgi:hypothetical protein